MFAAMLLAISIVALTQFAAYYWRAILAGVAAQPVSERMLEAANLGGATMQGRDFEKLAGLHELTPDLQSGNDGLLSVRVYYRALGWLAARCSAHLSSLAAWCEEERVLCARYAAVQVDRRLQANLALAEALRSC